MLRLSAFEICAGAGGQLVGLESAGFDAVAAVELDRDACITLRTNRPRLEVLEKDIREIKGRHFKGVDLLAGGVPCPPFTIAGKQLGHKDERDLFPEALRLVAELKPRAVMLENVPGFASPRFSGYRTRLMEKLRRLGYEADFQLMNSCWFGVPQLRPRVVLIAFRDSIPKSFQWPKPVSDLPPTVGEVLGDLMGERGWAGASNWQVRANSIAPTLVGGSKKHGGPDLGPTRAKRQWAALGVDGHGLANEAPGPDHPLDFTPRLTVRMTARIQSFPDAWIITGGKTAAYRQIGNAFPPPFAKAVGRAIRAAVLKKRSEPRRSVVQIPLFKDLDQQERRQLISK